MPASVVAALALICGPLNALATIRGEKCGLVAGAHQGDVRTALAPGLGHQGVAGLLARRALASGTRVGSRCGLLALAWESTRGAVGQDERLVASQAGGGKEGRVLGHRPPHHVGEGDQRATPRADLSSVLQDEERAEVEDDERERDRGEARMGGEEAAESLG